VQVVTVPVGTVLAQIAREQRLAPGRAVRCLAGHQGYSGSALPEPAEQQVPPLAVGQPAQERRLVGRRAWAEQEQEPFVAASPQEEPGMARFGPAAEERYCWPPSLPSRAGCNRRKCRSPSN
jgi:hypothetical protein